ncbi:FimD/PapC N-terminal domain-containing protein, partial [Variovorax sp.]|uniref:FimD/PapC N-terminal domain-containing protein n=1 Tax=Variovorax sp. TaxID=1871043 RepID=UPI002D592259
MATAASATVASATAAEDIAFPTTFLRTRPNETVDVARFSRANQVAPGVYNLDILVNGRRLDRIDVRFVGA